MQSGSLRSKENAELPFSLILSFDGMGMVRRKHADVSALTDGPGAAIRFFDMDIRIRCYPARVTEASFQSFKRYIFMVCLDSHSVCDEETAG